MYPTVDLELRPGNHRDLTDTTRMANVTFAQAAQLQQVCALYAPLYHQVTLGTYLQPRERLEAGLALAFADVERAFAEYLAKYDRGRKLVLIGHSQGAEMVVRLVKRFFEPDPKLRDRLLFAMPIGGDVETAPGSDRGGTFVNLPICTKEGQVGCVVAYRSWAQDRAVVPGRTAPPAGRVTACVSPADVAGTAPHELARSIFHLTPEAAKHLHGIDDVRTPFVAFTGYYRASCADGPAGFRTLSVDVKGQPGDARPPPIDFERDLPKNGLLATLGLHLLDLQLPQGDLIELIRRASP